MEQDTSHVARHGSLAAQVAEEVLAQIVDGRLAPGSELPPEQTLAEEFGVSRLTAREALKTLQSQGLVRAVHGRRGVVNPVSEWVALEPVVRETVHRVGREAASVQLVEMRRMIEVGAASLAAQRRTPEECDELDRLVDDMATATTANDVEAFVRADISFHDTIFVATRNVFVKLVFEPLHQVMLERRRETSAVPQVQVNALEWHRAVAAAIRAGDPDAAREAMLGHMDQTERDLRDLVFRPS